MQRNVLYLAHFHWKALLTLVCPHLYTSMRARKVSNTPEEYVLFLSALSHKKKQRIKYMAVAARKKKSCHNFIDQTSYASDSEQF